MYHSIIFYKNDDFTSGLNTYDDWFLIPTSRPVFNPPAVKTKYIDIPGADGVIDLTETLRKCPVYNNREGSLEFIVENGHKNWSDAYSTVMDYIHGQYVKAVLEDDPEYYYEGRFFVNEWKSDKNWSLITLDYNLKPYKTNIHSTTEEWIWDTFNFETGIILKDIIVDSTEYKWVSLGSLIGRKPVCPIFTVTTDSSIYVKIYNKELGIDTETVLRNGTYRNPEIMLSNTNGINEVSLAFKGVGTVSMDFRNGGL